jgi:hypothetical protein
MQPAHSVTHPTAAAGDHYFLLLGGLLLGYAVFGKLVAYLGIPPLFIGEIVLFAGCIVAFRTGCLPATLASTTSILLASAMVWVMVRTLPYVPVYGFNALRDSVVLMYGTFAFIIIALLLEDGRRLATALHYYSKFVAVFIPASPLMFALAYYPDGALRFIRPGEVAVHLAGATVFALAGFRKLTPLTFMALIAALLMSVAMSRGAMLAYIVPVVLGTLLLGKARELILVMVAGLFIVATAYGIETALTDSQVAQRNSVDRTLSVSQIVENAASIFSQSGNQTESTKTWRIDWWNIIINDTFFGPHFWTGRGFGLNLADADGFWDGDNPDAPPLRSPHNAHMTMLARGGIPGLALWGAVMLSWFVSVASAMLVARRYKQQVWANMFLVVACYVLAMLINASFDVALEGPMQGIWFWCLIGFGIGSTMIYRATLPPCAPQAATK